MYSLEVEHVKRLEEKLAEASMNDPSLSVDILDHLCCMVEEKIDTGFNYPEAEKAAFTELGIMQIQAIEAETKKLTRNHITMKKRTKIIGFISVGLMITGFLMKQLHLMGANLIWMIGVFATVFGFTLFLTVDRFSYDKSAKEIMLNILGFIGAGAFLIGFGMRFLSWPGAGDSMIIGGSVLCIHFLINNIFLRHEKIS